MYLYFDYQQYASSYQSSGLGTILSYFIIIVRFKCSLSIFPRKFAATLNTYYNRFPVVWFTSSKATHNPHSSQFLHPNNAQPIFPSTSPTLILLVSPNSSEGFQLYYSKNTEKEKFQRRPVSLS